MSFGYGVLLALALLVVPGAIIARCSGIGWPAAVAVGPALTYGAVAMAIVPFGALGVPWNAWTALLVLAVIAGAATGLRALLRRRGDPDDGLPSTACGPALLVAAGVLLGALLIWLAAARGLANWQSIPSTWDAV